MIFMSVLLAASAAVVPVMQGPPDTITAGILRDWPPYYLRDANGQPTGFAVDIMNDVAARSGFAVRYRTFRTYPDLISALDSDLVDVVPNMGIVPGRRYLYTTSVDVFSVSVFVRESDLTARTLDDIAGPVAVVESNVGEQLVDRVGSSNVVVFSGVREALFRLVSGDVDALVYPSPVIWALARTAGMDGRIRMLGPPLMEVRRALAVAEQDTALRDKLEAGVSTLLRSQDYEDIYSAWHRGPEPWWNTARVVQTALLVLAGLLALGLTLRVRARRRFEKAQLAAATQIQFQAQLLDLIGEGLVAVDDGGRVIFWSLYAETLYGWTRAEAMGRLALDLIVPDEQRTAAQEAIAKVMGGDGWSGEMPMRRRDGTTFDAFLTITPIRDGQGRVTGAVAAGRDISDRKMLEEQLRRSQRMESVGRLAGGIAHDFNNLLTVISGNVELALNETPEDGPGRGELFHVRKAASRAAELTRQLLAFSRKQSPRPITLNLNDLLLNVREMFQRLIGEDVRLEMDTPADLGNVRADPSQIEQVLLNMVINARDAMPEGGTLTIRTANLDLETSRVVRHAEVPPGRYVELTIADTGVGMGEETMDKVFEPFFTTKDQGRGTGLGLATVYGIVHEHRGHVCVDSRPGVGTQFSIYLPRVFEDVTRAPRHTPQGTRGTETVLVVEDEPSLRRLVERVLQMSGYRVLIAEGPLTALEMVRQRPERIDLVLTDIVMPDMHGPELVSRLAEIRSGVRVLYMSGYPARALTEKGVAGLGAPILGKPFDIAVLSQKVRETLDAPIPSETKADGA